MKYRQDELYVVHTTDSGRVTVIRLTQVGFKRTPSRLESVDSGFWDGDPMQVGFPTEYEVTLKVKKTELELRVDQKIARKVKRLLGKLHSHAHLV